MENVTEKLRMDFVAPVSKKKTKGIGKRARLTFEIVRQIKELCEKHNVDNDIRFGYETNYFYFYIKNYCELSGYNYPEKISKGAAKLLQDIKKYFKDLKSSSELIRIKSAAINSMGV